MDAFGRLSSRHTRSTARSRRGDPSLASEADPLTPWFGRRPDLRRLCLRWTRGNPSDADDLLGEACLRVFEAARSPEVGVIDSFAFWATVINNLGRDRLRQARRDQHDDRVTGPEVLPAATLDGEVYLLVKENLAAAIHGLRRLNARERAALLLRAQGAAYDRIGIALKTTATNARKLVQTARQRLKTESEHVKPKVRLTTLRFPRASISHS